VGRNAERALKVAHLDAGAGMRGGQRQVLALVRGLRARWVGSVVLARSGPLGDAVRGDGIPVAEWRPRGDLDPGALAVAIAFLRRHRPDLVHAHDARSHALGWAAARIAGVRAFVVARRTDAPVAGHAASRLKYRLPVDRYLAVSAGVADTLGAAGVRAERVTVVPDGIVLDGPPDTGDLRAALGLPPDARIACMAAAWTPEKGHDLAIAALGRLAPTWPELHLVLMGDGPPDRRHALDAQVVGQGLTGRVHFLPWRDDARAVMRQCDVLLAPSRIEGLGTAVIEAQAEGVPVVASAAGGLPELVRDGATGLLVPVGDSEALARAVAAVLADPDAARLRAAHARVTVRAFSVENTVERTLAVYHEVLGALDAPRAPR
jgi:glycosyltransferase involved in cell wall biosynthesis